MTAPSFRTVGTRCKQATSRTVNHPCALPPLSVTDVRPRPKGFSLFELLLVLAILVLIGALAAPSVQQTLARHSLGSSAERVRVAMGKARIKAIREGKIYAFFFLENGSWFRAAPFSQLSQQVADATERQKIADQPRPNYFEEDLLPPGTRFASGIVSDDARAAEAFQQIEGSDSQSVHPVLFYPDGTSQDARVVLQNEQGALIEVRLRGLTGQASVHRIDKEAR